MQHRTAGISSGYISKNSTKMGGRRLLSAWGVLFLVAVPVVSAAGVGGGRLLGGLVREFAKESGTARARVWRDLNNEYLGPGPGDLLNVVIKNKKAKWKPHEYMEANRMMIDPFERFNLQRVAMDDQRSIARDVSGGSQNQSPSRKVVDELIKSSGQEALIPHSSNPTQSLAPSVVAPASSDPSSTTERLQPPCQGGEEEKSAKDGRESSKDQERAKAGREQFQPERAKGESDDAARAPSISRRSPAVLGALALTTAVLAAGLKRHHAH